LIVLTALTLWNSRALPLDAWDAVSYFLGFGSPAQRAGEKFRRPALRSVAAGFKAAGDTIGIAGTSIEDANVALLAAEKAWLDQEFAAIGDPVMIGIQNGGVPKDAATRAAYQKACYDLAAGLQRTMIFK
jgi:hypothetical protein